MSPSQPNSGLPSRGNVPSAELEAMRAPLAPIDADLMAALPSLPLRARYLVSSFLTGRHRSPIKGTAPEFAEYRSYQFGDDLRRLDWRLYARSDRLAVKQFEDENQLQSCLVLDVSASMRFASRPGLLSKFDLARTVLGAIALLARRQCDAVGLALLGETDAADGGLVDFFRPSASIAHHHTIFSKLEAPPTTQSAALGLGLRRLVPLLPGGGLVVLTSDFYCDLPDLADTLHFLRAHRLDVIGVHVLDPLEAEFGTEEAGRFVDLETGAFLPLNGAAARAGYRKRFGEFQRELGETFQEHNADLVTLRTDANPLPALAAYLARRARLA